jgi:hypothetical protein
MKRGLVRRLAPVLGLVSLIWFLVRVIPKPSRASYPCQRAAFPIASGFVIWLAGVLGSGALLRRGRGLWRQSRVAMAWASVVAAVVLALGSLATMPQPSVLAEPNKPLGVGKGIYPGRVVWAHDPKATNWNGPGDGHWWEENHTIQPAVDGMMSGAVRRLAGESNDTRAWDALFRNFNQAHGGGKAAYKKGEKITIKVNFVGCIYTEGNVNPQTYDLGGRRIDYMNTSPQMIRALLRQLVKRAGVAQGDITVGDTLALFPNQYYDLLHGEFPDVHYMDRNGGVEGHPRTKVTVSSMPVYWSTRPDNKEQDFVPQQFAEAKYLINLANLKSHTMAGVTLCGKNHFGSLIRTPPQKGYFDLHASTAGRDPGMGKYRDLVDLIGSNQLGGKTLVYFIDGLYPGIHSSGMAPVKWNQPPFNGAWAASLLASQDPVAIDSVGFDFLWTEWDNYPRMSGADDYLHEAALADNPPSGTFYDPNHPTASVRLASLGVHEHWNNAQDRQYSRNLGKAEGIELLRAE